MLNKPSRARRRPDAGIQISLTKKMRAAMEVDGDLGFDFVVPSDEEQEEGNVSSSSSSAGTDASISVGSIPSPSASPAGNDRQDFSGAPASADGGAGAAAGAAPASAPAPAATPDAERQILLLMLLAQVCSLHDPTPRTFTVHVLSLFERGILDRESVRFLFDLGLVPGDYQYGAALADGGSGGGTGAGATSNHRLLEYDTVGEGWQQEQTNANAVVPYSKDAHADAGDTFTTGSKQTAHTTSAVKSQPKQKSKNGSGGRSRSNSRVQSSDLNTGDSAILGAVVGEDICDDGNGDDYDCHYNDPLRDIFGDDVEEATRDHRRRIMEKARALQVAERRRREVEVQSIKEYFERHDSVLSDEARMDAEARLASSVRSVVGANANASASASQKMAGSSASSVDESIRGGTSSGGDNARAPQHQQQQTPGASWSVASHPLSLSRYARDFISIGLLASGAFGDVYRAKSKFDQSEYAIKRVCFTAKGFDSATVQTVIREVQCLAQLDHPNVVRYYTSWLEPSWMTGGGKEVDIDTVGTEEERGRLLEGVKRLVLLEEGKAGTGQSLGTGEDTMGTLERDLRQLGISPQNSNSSKYGDHVDTGFSFESREYGDDSAYSEWSNYGAANESQPRWVTKRDFSASGQEAGDDSSITRGVESNVASVSSIEGGERSGDAKARKQQQPFHQANRQGRRPSQQAFMGRQYKYRICLFVQMQLCRPTTLADWIQARNYSARSGTLRDQSWVESALRIFLQITQGLAHIHSKGIIHRDLKPANCFAALDGGAEGEFPCFRIGDFGLSKMLLDANGGKPFENIGHSNALAVPLEAHTVGIGTASYASPEQVTSSTYGPPADIYSMGLILLEFFSTIDSLHERATVFGNCRRGVLPDRLCEEFPEISSIVADCTHDSPAKRPTARMLQDAIELCLRKHDSPPGPTFSSQKNAEDNSSEIVIEELRMKLKEREDEVTRLRHLLIKKDEIIDHYKRKLESQGNDSNPRATSGEAEDDDLVQSRSMSSDEDY